MNKNKEANIIKEVLSNTYMIFTKTLNYHWNIEGENFYSDHKLLENQYEEMLVMCDDLAESLRSLNSKSPGSFSEFKKLSFVKDGRSSLKRKEMLKDLAGDQERLIELIEAGKKSLKTEFVLSRITDTETKLAKFKWMLESSI